MYPSSYPMSARLVIVGLMALNVLTLGVVSCTRSFTKIESAPIIVYHIPEANKDKAAEMVVNLVQRTSTLNWSPQYVQEQAWNTVSKLYGEPVAINKGNTK